MLTSKRFVILALVIYVIGSANAGPLTVQVMSTTRIAVDPLEVLLGYIQEMLAKIPVVGEMMVSYFADIQEVAANIERRTNGFLGKLLNGVLPCTINVDSMDCEGLQPNGRFIPVFLDAVENLPPSIMPNVFKSGIKLVTELGYRPVLAALSGGR